MSEPIEASYTVTDSDGAGLPDGWETDHFPSLTKIDGSIESDSNGDGRSDRDEWPANTSPANLFDYLTLTDVEFTNEGRSNTMSWESKPGRNCIERLGTGVFCIKFRAALGAKFRIRCFPRVAFGAILPRFAIGGCPV